MSLLLSFCLRSRDDFFVLSRGRSISGTLAAVALAPHGVIINQTLIKILVSRVTGFLEFEWQGDLLPIFPENHASGAVSIAIASPLKAMLRHSSTHNTIVWLCIFEGPCCVHVLRMSFDQGQVLSDILREDLLSSGNLISLWGDFLTHRKPSQHHLQSFNDRPISRIFAT